MRMKLRLRRQLQAFVALCVGLTFLLPLYVSLVTSLDTRAHVFTFPPHLSLDWQWGNYARAWHMFRWMMYFGNTLFIAGVTIALALTTSVLAAYALSFIEFRGREAVFVAILLVMMIPGEAQLIPNFVTLNLLHLLDTYWAQILPYGVSVFGIFLLRQFFLSLPKDYWEAARMDGCGHLRYLWSIALPLCRPVLFTISLHLHRIVEFAHVAADGDAESQCPAGRGRSGALPRQQLGGLAASVGRRDFHDNARDHPLSVLAKAHHPRRVARRGNPGLTRGAEKSGLPDVVAGTCPAERAAGGAWQNKWRNKQGAMLWPGGHFMAAAGRSAERSSS